MAVVVNEFEVVTEQPPGERKERGGGSGGDEGNDSPPLAPEEIARALCRQHERMERVRAY